MKTIQEELEFIASEHDNILRAEDVVMFAKNPNTALHKQFTWDDSEAARLYRLEEARRIIRVHLKVVENVAEPVRMFVSLVPDRKEPGGGYRPIDEVMQNEAMRLQLLKQFREDIRRMEVKYRTLKEAAPVLAAIRQTLYPMSEAAD